VVAILEVDGSARLERTLLAELFDLGASLLALAQVKHSDCIHSVSGSILNAGDTLLSGDSCYVLLEYRVKQSSWNLQMKQIGAAPIIYFSVGGSFSHNPETIFLLGPGGMHVEHHAASAPRCRGAGDQRCVEMIT